MHRQGAISEAKSFALAITLVNNIHNSANIDRPHHDMMGANYKISTFCDRWRRRIQAYVADCKISPVAHRRGRPLKRFNSSPETSLRLVHVVTSGRQIAIASQSYVWVRRAERGLGLKNVIQYRG